jgi:branched-chain amino acid transport system permease protein
MNDFIFITISGAANGCLYALLLLGILLVFRVSRAVNFAAGQIGMFGALFAFYSSKDFSTLSSQGGGWYLPGAILPIGVAIVVGMIVSALIGMLFDVGVMRRIPQDVFGFDLIATIGGFLLLTTAGENIFGNRNRLGPDFWNSNFVELGELRINSNDLLVMALTVVIVLVTILVLKTTTAGLQSRASAESPDIAQSLGIPVHRVRTITWGIAGALAAVAALLISSRMTVSPYLVTPFLLKAFIAGILGGLNRLVAPLLVAVFLGIYESWAVFFFASTARIPAVFTAIIVSLMIIPKRYLIEDQEARA